MNINDMKYFIKVCDNRSISATSESFFMSPQGVSKSLYKDIIDF